jgi:predicted ATPase
LRPIPGRGYRFSAELDRAADRKTDETASAPAPATASAPVPSATKSGEPFARPGNLPPELPLLYGRDKELAALSMLIDAHRLVTVVGAGGIGKSRLAQAAAHAATDRWIDGVWMVELAGLADPTLLPNVVAQTLHVALPGQGPAHDELVAGLSQRTLLLVLDNCEHLLDAAAALAQAIVRGARHVTLLATSQEPLHVADEQQFRVVPLSIPAPTTAASGARDFGAVALFEARVRAVDPRFALNDENLPLVIDICRQLDGLPLAIELAAARVSTLGLRPVRDKLDARFKLLTGGARSTLRRHQTLRAALEWSHNLLNDAERAVFRRLGVFAGGFTIETAQAVATDEQIDEWAVLDHLSALVDKSLVVADAGDAPRYRLLESARAFALEQLAAVETADTLRRHASAMRKFIERIDDANLDGELRTHEYAALVLPELDNLRAAHAWAIGESGDIEAAVSLAAHAGALIDYAIECAEWLLQLRTRVEAGPVSDPVAARYWRALAASNMAGTMPRAVQVDAATRAKALYQALGHPRRVFSCLIQITRHSNAQGRVAVARAALEEARTLIRPDWPVEFRILLLRQDATIALDAGRFDDAQRLYQEGVRISTAAGDWRLEVIARTNLINFYWKLGPIERAADEARILDNELRKRPAAANDMATSFANVLGILSEMGRTDEAFAAAREALPIMHRARTLYVESWAYLFWRRGQLDVAARLLGASDTVVTRTGVPLQVNEDRLIAEARAGLQTALPRDDLERYLAEGAGLGEEETFALIASGLEANR